MAHAAVAWCGLCTWAHAEEPATAAPSRAQCLAQHEHAQDARLAGQLLAARLSLRECSAATCPHLVSHDCVSWLSEVQQQIPSVIFRAAKDGEDVATLKVREGEQLLTESLTGTPLELDPGPHHFVAELPGFAVQEATYVLQAGDKGRVVRFDFVSPPAAPATTPKSPKRQGPPPPPPPRPIPRLTYVLGGATLAAAATGGVLGVLALSERQDVRARCAPLCRPSDVRGFENLALASDISFGLAVLGAGASVYSYVSRPELRRAGAASAGANDVRVSLRWTGLGLSAGGSF